MTYTTRLSDKRLGEVETFLDDMLHGCELPYQIRKNPDGTVTIDLHEQVADFLKTYDHDCKLTPEDGCSYCGLLQEIGLSPEHEPEFDEYDFEFYQEEEE